MRNTDNNIDSNISESQQEIMEKIPSSLSNIGTIFLLFVFIILTILGYSIQYPDTLSGQATLNSLNPAINLAMPSTGKITLISEPKKATKEGDIIAIVDNPANYKDVYFIKNTLSDFHQLNILEYDTLLQKLSINVELGELKVPYYKFLIALMNIKKQSNTNIYNQEIKTREDKIRYQKNNLAKIKEMCAASESKLNYAVQSLSRDSLLYNKGVVSKNEFESSTASYLQQKIQHDQYILEYQTNENSIKNIENEILQLNLQILKSNDDLKSSLLDSYANLISAVEIWEKKYSITSPINGIVEYMQFWKPNQYIGVNTDLFCIFPNDKISEVEVVIPTQGVGKIKKGQKAIIKLTDFPSKEYGDLRGTVKDISLSKVPVEGQYHSFIKVSLNNDGLTSYGILVELKSGMPATVDIVTENKRLIERLFDRFRYAFDKVE